MQHQTLLAKNCAKSRYTLIEQSLTHYSKNYSGIKYTCLLNTYFESVFMKENLTNIPTMSGTNNPESTLPIMPRISF